MENIKNSSDVDLSRIVDRICSIRKGGMDDKQFKATVELNMSLIIKQAEERERERIWI